MAETKFWGVDLGVNMLKPPVPDEYKLIPLKFIHSTLLFAMPRNKSKEKMLAPLENLTCDVYILGYRYSKSAAIMIVEKIVAENTDEIIPSFSNFQHITLALREGFKAKDSVKLTSRSHTYQYNMLIKGCIRRYV